MARDVGRLQSRKERDISETPKVTNPPKRIWLNVGELEEDIDFATLRDWECITWCDIAQDEADIAYALDSELAAVERECDELREALRELVRLKDLHDRIDKYERMLSDQPLDEYLQERADYKRGKPLAWDKARAILAAGRVT